MICTTKRRLNERKFLQWVNLPNKGRKYWYEVEGKSDFMAKYVKEVDEEESTVKFYQEIYDEEGVLIEVHEKYPVDNGHRKLGGDKDDNN